MSAPRAPSPEPAPQAGRVGVASTAVALWIRRAATLAVCSPLALAVVNLVFRPPHAAWVPYWMASLIGGPLAFVVLALTAAVVAMPRWRARGRLDVQGDGVALEDAAGNRLRQASSAEVRAGLVMPLPTGARVEIELEGGDRLLAEVPDVAAGEALLRRAGLDAGRRRCQLAERPVASTMFVRLLAVVGTIVTSVVGLGAVISAFGPPDKAWVPVFVFGTAAAAAAASALVRPATVTVGADGIAIQRRFKRSFVPFEDVASIEARGREVVFTRRDGTAELIKVERGYEPAAAALALRAREAMAARGEERAPAAVKDALARGGRSIAQWRADLKALRRRADGYREAGPSREDLLEVLGSASASSEQRVGAALALSSEEDPGEERAARLRVAADACAAPRLRVALEAMADGGVDEAAIEDALAEAEGAVQEATALSGGLGAKPPA